MRKAISFFLVEYEAGDLIGLFLGWCCFVPPFVIAIQTTILVCLWLQSLTATSGPKSKPNRVVQLAAYMLLGQLLNEALNLILKNFIKQPRPNSKEYLRKYPLTFFSR